MHALRAIRHGIISGAVLLCITPRTKKSKRVQAKTKSTKHVTAVDIALFKVQWDTCKVTVV